MVLSLQATISHVVEWLLVCCLPRLCVWPITLEFVQESKDISNLFRFVCLIIVLGLFLLRICVTKTVSVHKSGCQLLEHFTEGTLRHLLLVYSEWQPTRQWCLDADCINPKHLLYITFAIYPLPYSLDKLLGVTGCGSFCCPCQTIYCPEFIVISDFSIHGGQMWSTWPLLNKYALSKKFWSESSDLTVTSDTLYGLW